MTDDQTEGPFVAVASADDGQTWKEVARGDFQRQTMLRALTYIDQEKSWTVKQKASMRGTLEVISMRELIMIDQQSYRAEEYLNGAYPTRPTRQAPIDAPSLVNLALVEYEVEPMLRLDARFDDWFYVAMQEVERLKGELCK